jgi:hypothetical protein
VSSLVEPTRAPEKLGLPDEGSGGKRGDAMHRVEHGARSTRIQPEQQLVGLVQILVRLKDIFQDVQRFGSPADSSQGASGEKRQGVFPFIRAVHERHVAFAPASTPVEHRQCVVESAQANVQLHQCLTLLLTFWRTAGTG